MTEVSRRLARAALVASTALALGAPAMAAPGKGGMCHPGMSRLTVTGEGEARVAPDLATIQLGVTTQAASAAEAMEQNSTRQTAVIEGLTGAGIDQADVQTSGLNLNPVMDYGEGRAPTITGYQASNMVAVRVKDIPRLGEVLDAIVAAGANEINGITFTRDDNADTEDQARRAAVEDARHKAEVLAEAAGLTLGPVLVLRDTPTPEGPRPMMMEARAAADAAKVPVAPGELGLSAQVEMQFALTGQDCGPMGGRHGDGHRGMHDGHPPAHGGDTGAPSPEGMRDRGDLPPGHPPVPGGDAAGAVPGDMPPPMGTDTGAPEAGEPVVPMGEAPAEGQPPAN
ncbi:SIMPL domain-containing protein [Paracoccus sp. (in: a-proteobacteria)]|uniref:SIMPL domain-containing protein n=1 Tax=Paracoccus sp. TaxID=267 RepID=UPI0035B2DB95